MIDYKQITGEKMMRKYRLIVLVVMSAVLASADVATLFTDTTMANWTGAYTSGAITNVTATPKAGAGNPVPAVEFKAYRDSTGVGTAKVLEDSAFELDLPSFYSANNAQSIESFDISLDVQYSVGNAFVVFRKWDSNDQLVVEGITSAFLAAGNSTWATKTINVAAEAAAFQSQGSSMTFDNEAYHYTFGLIFQSNVGAVFDSIGYFDNFQVDVNYTAVPEPATLSLFAISGFVLLLCRKRMAF